jgi:hypothetical protein
MIVISTGSERDYSSQDEVQTIKPYADLNQFELSGFDKLLAQE